MTRTSARWSGESGAELIEFAFVLPLMLLVVLGIIDFGFLFQRYEVITNAAREGARVAVLPGYADADVVARVDQYLAAAGLTDGGRVVSTVHPPPIPVITATAAYCATVTSVTVTYPYGYSFVGGIASYFGGGTLATRTGLTATSEMRNEIPAAGPGCL
jgi:Flp pilus assembly protein TadG